MSSNRQHISVVTACYNEEENVEEAYRQVRAVFDSLEGYAYDHIFIDNASTDKTVAILKNIAKDYRNVKIIVNTRNFGHIRSPYYALLQTSGDAMAKEEKRGYGKCMKNLRLRPVVLSAVTYEDIQKRAESVPQKEIRKRGIARMLREEADVQGGTLAETDLSLILSCSNMTIYKNITEYERENNVVLPRRGTVHDLGRSTTHKKIICRKSVQDRKATPDIARETYHSPSAVDRYLGDFDRVRFCLKKGLSVEETSFTTQLNKSLVVEYEDLIEELYGDGEKENVN